MKECLIVCNGHLTKKDLYKYTKLNKPRKVIDVIACDGASDFLKNAGVIPDVIIGDFDSVKPQTFKYFSKRKVLIKQVIDQNKNDLEKAIIFALSKKYKVINITGLTGKRLDHTLNNISILMKYHKKAKIWFYENGFEGMIVSKKAEFSCKIGDIVSLIPLPKASGVTASGLKYPLKNETLEMGVRTGALNEALKKNVNVSVKKGLLLVLARTANIKFGFPPSRE
ncbi:MAG: thiamine diphosphokinase [Ignavibacteria bacterium]